MNDPVRALAQRLLEKGFEELPERERRVIQRVANRLAISRNIGLDYDSHRSFGERLADQVAQVGGSWRFIIAFSIFIAIWALLNTIVLLRDAFDPYPFIFLNLMLSLLAAVQAPIIMMSQNRQAAKDRLAAEHDYEVNLKAEIEIAALHEKLDSLRSNELKAILERIERGLSRDGAH